MVSHSAAGAPKPRAESWLGAVQTLTPTAWITGKIAENVRYRLTAEPSLTLLARFRAPGVERPAEWRSFWAGRYGPNYAKSSPLLGWNELSCEHADPLEAGAPEPVASLIYEFDLGPALANDWQLPPADAAPLWAIEPSLTPAPSLLPVSKEKYCAPWQRTRPVTVLRYGAEHDVFKLLECDGSIAVDALDRLSVLARPPGSPRPELPLPLEPQIVNDFGEWLPEVKLLHPRVLWLLEQVAEAFPSRAIYLISGYRRDGHGSYHRQGRALDLFVKGVANEDLFKFCRRLTDVGCGYYPNSTFVHLDVRPFGTGHPMWIDISEPSQPSHYVDSWPGITERANLGEAGEG